MTRNFVLFVVSGLLLSPVEPLAQTQTPPVLLRGVPNVEAAAEPLQLSLADAVRRGLTQNLAAILEEQRLRGTESLRLAALSELLPHVSGYVRRSDQIINTAAFGFTFPGVPTLIGPFPVFDARVAVSAPLFDARALGGYRAVQATVHAGQADLREVRETVVLAVGTLYLQTEADAARVESTRAQVATAETLVRLAEDQRAAGLVAGIDVLRQQVQLESARARVIVAENAYEKRKLSLARAIGLPANQLFVLSDTTRFVAAPALTADEAVGEAAAHREDLKAAQARVESARFARTAESAGNLPSVHLDGDVGSLGNHASDSERTYSIAATVRVPIFQGGDTRARVQRADVELRQREAELADLTSGIRYDVQAALLDVKAAETGVGVADSARTLARQELEQAQDRFRAGVASTLELVQAQESVANSTEQYISSVYAHAVAKGSLTRAIGQVEQRFVAVVGGQP